MGYTLRAIREQAVRGYKQRWYAEGTVGTTGTTTILPDTNRQEPAGEWDRVDSWLHLIGGALDGQVRKVTGFTAGVSVQVGPALASAIPSGQQYALYKEFDPINDFNVFINAGLREITAERTITSFATAAEVYPSGGEALYVYNVPSAAANRGTTLIKIDRSVGTTASPYDYTELLEGRDYEIWKSENVTTIRIKYMPVNGQLLRYHYQHIAADLVNDTDVTDEPLNLILYFARKHIALAEGDNDAFKKWAALAEQEKSIWENTQEQIRTKVPRVVVRGGL